MGISSRPVVNAMLVCDKVITEARTSKKSLIGIFENINSFSFPCVHPSLSVYIKLTDAKGAYKFVLKLVDLETGGVISCEEIPEEVEINDPLLSYELIFNLSGLKLEHPGKYEFQIFSNDEVIGQKTFIVQQAKKA